MITLLALIAIASAPATPRPLLGEAIAVREWRVARNRATCAPLALATAGGVKAKARRAYFSGGWGVAFDSPGRRSAYGFAGVGLLNEDRLSHAQNREALQRQWPYLRDLPGLPRGSLAGYGLTGAAPYPERNPAGRGLYSAAYVRIPGQSCLYNVWSQVSRQHLETLLDNLRIVAAPAKPPR